MKKRIWELDLLRGCNLFVMIAVHFLYDIVYLFPLVPWHFPDWFDMVIHFFGAIFVMLSGICATLGRHPIRRGLTVLGAGMICTAVTAALAWTGLCGREIIIYFGVLHCLGCCMLLWPLFQRWKGWMLIGFGVILFALGVYLSTLRSSSILLIPLGVVTPEFASSDYFPLVRQLGVFLVGAGGARYLYKEPVSLWTRVRPDRQPIRFFGWWGRNSLMVYLLHQPLLAALAAGLYFLIA